MSVINVSYIYRAHSSGWGERIEKNFSTFEKASAYLKEVFDDYLKFNHYPEEWDDEDMYTDESRETPAPAPTETLRDELFSVDNLKAFVKNKKRTSDILYGYWSDFECQLPFEITVKEVSLD